LELFKKKTTLKRKAKMEIPESTACTSRSMASAFTRGDIKN
jgi:hypothetical protein